MKLKLIITKPSNESWQLNLLDTSTCVNTKESDPRDNSESNQVRKQFRRKVHPQGTKILGNDDADGYTGWDRTYVDDNTLVITYYFDSLENIIKYLEYAKSVIASDVVPIEENDPQKNYIRKFKIYDDNDIEVK